ncbi:MAG: sodium/proline symporter, partial [Bradymonadaceae bacterium]
LVGDLMPGFIVGIYIAVVLAAIMSTIDSLLVVAGSAAVRDWYQKIRHPDLPNDELVSMSRAVTAGLALCALGISMTVAVLSPNRTVFWFVIFGWSGIASTFCPAVILSLFWTKMTARGTVAAMVAGFLAVPFFKFGAPTVGPFFDALGELPTAFSTSFLFGIGVSFLDSPGQRDLEGVEEDLAAAGADERPDASG